MSRRLVADTHALVFLLAARAKLGRRARTALEHVEQGQGELWIPAAALAEVVLLNELGRVQIGIVEVRAAMNASPGFGYLPLDLDQLEEFASLGTIRDPFDRLIVAAARSLGAALVSRDAAAAAKGHVATIWD